MYISSGRFHMLLCWWWVGVGTESSCYVWQAIESHCLGITTTTCPVNWEADHKCCTYSPLFWVLSSDKNIFPPPPPPHTHKHYLPWLVFRLWRGGRGGRGGGDSASCITQLEGISGPVSTLTITSETWLAVRYIIYCILYTVLYTVVDKRYII